jgi:redox-sensitive bicupin YhaK (pirin superfamily)
MTVRKVKMIQGSVPTVEGAGVHLFRAFGFLETDLTDPFLLLDDFHGSDYNRYMAGFP